MEETLGKRIVKNRKRLGMTQDALAEKLGVTAQAVSKWENDQSCPDITTLPKLAEIFGVSTDSLLGLEPPVKEAEVVEEPGTGIHIDKNNNQWEFKWDGGRKGHLTLAVWVMAAALMLLAGNMLETPVSLWTALWTTGLVTFGLFHLCNRFSLHGLGCALAGGYFIAEELLPAMPMLNKSYLLPILLLLFGVSLLMKAMKKQKKPSFRIKSSGEKKCTYSYEPRSDSFDCELAFGEHRQAVELPILRRGEAEVSFGELVLDLRGCGSFSEDCRLELECNFGSLTVVLPESVRAVSNAESFAGNVRVTGQPRPDARTVLLECGANFGEIHIQYLP